MISNQHEVEHGDVDEISPIGEGLDSREESSGGASVPVSLVARIVAWLPLVIFFLGTGRNPWVLSFVALVVGVLVLLNPPQTKLPFLLLIVMVGIAVLTLIPLLPVAMPFPPSWRVSLSDDLGVQLAPTWSVQPFVTLENWLLMVVVMTWFAWLVSQDGITQQRTHILRVVASGVAWLAVVSFGILLWRAGIQPLGPAAPNTTLGPSPIVIMSPL